MRGNFYMLGKTSIVFHWCNNYFIICSLNNHIAMELRRNVRLAPFTTYKLGGNADFFIEVTREDIMVRAILYAQEQGIPFFILGTGANILISDQGFRGLVIRNLCQHHEITVHPSHEYQKTVHYQDGGTKSFLATDKQRWYRAASGVVIADAISYTKRNGLSGLEHFAGIPSTVGGALWQNLHFLNPKRDGTVYIGDILHHATLLNLTTGQKNMLYREDFLFGYDTSVLHKKQHILLNAVFQLEEMNPITIQNRIDANITWRNERHPSVDVEYSCGSVFKKVFTPNGWEPAAKFIDQAGLKGFAVGGVRVSEKHPNFIVHNGTGTAQEVYALIHWIQHVVYETIGIHLSPEIGYVGTFEPINQPSA
jgi:UDP-N-acetylmuramate dehydrogenase